MRRVVHTGEQCIPMYCFPCCAKLRGHRSRPRESPSYRGEDRGRFCSSVASTARATSPSLSGRLRATARTYPSTALHAFTFWPGKRGPFCGACACCSVGFPGGLDFQREPQTKPLPLSLCSQPLDPAMLRHHRSGWRVSCVALNVNPWL